MGLVGHHRDCRFLSDNGQIKELRRGEKRGLDPFALALCPGIFGPSPRPADRALMYARPSAIGVFCFTASVRGCGRLISMALDHTQM